MTINPLCDKDLTAMSQRDLAIESTGAVEVLRAYVCDSDGCCRCYSEGSGYFDFIAGKLHSVEMQTLCERDGCGMFLEQASIQGDRIWRCPWCGEAVRF